MEQQNPLNSFQGKTDDDLRKIGLSDSTIADIRSKVPAPKAADANNFAVPAVTTAPVATATEAAQVTAPTAPAVAAPSPEPQGLGAFVSRAKQGKDRKELTDTEDSIATLSGRLQAERDLLQQKIDRDVAGGIPEAGLQAKYGRDLERITRQEQELAQKQQKLPELQAKVGAPLEAPVEEEAPASQQEQNDFMKAYQASMIQEQAAQQSGADLFNQQLAQLEGQWRALQERKVDPQRYWTSKTDGERTRAMWGIILGGFSKTGINPALQVLEQAQKADIAAQENEINKEYKILEQKKDILGMRAKMTKEGPPNVRLLAHKMKLLQATKAEGMRLGAKPGVNQQAMAQMMGHIDNQMAATQAQLADTIATGKAVIPADLVDGNTPLAFIDLRQRDSFVPGYGLAPSAKAASEFRTAAGEQENAIAGLERLIEMSKNGSKLNPEDRMRVASELKAAAGSLRLPLTGPGAMTEDEYQRLLDTIGDPNKLFSFKFLQEAKINTVLNKLKGDLDRKAGLVFQNYKPKYGTSSTFKSFTPSK